MIGRHVGSLLLAALVVPGWPAAPVRAQEPAHQLDAAAAAAPATPDDVAATPPAAESCDVCALRHQSMLRSRDHLRAVRREKHAGGGAEQPARVEPAPADGDQ